MKFMNINFIKDILSNVFEKNWDSQNFKMIYFNFYIILISSEMAKSNLVQKFN